MWKCDIGLHLFGEVKVTLVTDFIFMEFVSLHANMCYSVICVTAGFQANSNYICTAVLCLFSPEAT
jgi:hypothetical protein